MIEGALAARIEECPQGATDRDAEVLLTGETPVELLPDCVNEAERTRTRGGLAWPFFS